MAVNTVRTRDLEAYWISVYDEMFFNRLNRMY